MVKGPPKVTVRVDDDDIAVACRLAIQHYLSCVMALEQDIVSEAKKRAGIE
jgi:DNA-directed RNA polymerase subunit L